mmetsp:Transcript_9384/g.21171  ORF Transcript_9384/g.21171 Transcript_9384/m.21171 type:complete len:118 (+) Transcript_9384:429-782(+)
MSASASTSFQFGSSSHRHGILFTTAEQLKAYRRRHHRFPIRLPKYGPQTEMEYRFKELQSNCIAPPPRVSKSNTARSPTTHGNSWTTAPCYGAGRCFPKRERAGLCGRSKPVYNQTG